ncbi:MAG: hypothetical protein ACYDA3_14200 [Gaiellaceae bacterium]
MNIQIRRRTFGFLLVAAVAGATVATAAVQAAAPINTSAPLVSGQPYVGKILTSTTGGWQNGPTSYSYQWVRCDQNGNGCTQISGSTAKAYTPTSADVNHRLASWVTATNAGGTAGPVSSKPTTMITPALPPTNTTPPTIVGKPFVDEKLFADPGKYSGGAVASFGYQWERCPKTTLTCTQISGATSQNYKVVTADVGQRLRVQVTATNPFGKTTTASKPTEAITVAVVTVSTTLTASASSTTCCYRVHLSGTISPAKAGEPITVLGRQFDDLASYPLATTTTDATGKWSVIVTPMIQTDYTAQTSTSTSPAVTVTVHPRVGFGVRGKNTFSAKVTARNSFAGSVAWFQMQTASGGWRRIALVVINQFSVAKFHVTLKKGHTYNLRIYLPQPQAGPGYLNGISHTERVVGTK